MLEIRPSVEADKGTAVQALLAAVPARCGLFAGLAQAGLEHIVRIAVESEEGPGDLVAAADLTVSGPDELTRLLATL